MSTRKDKFSKKDIKYMKLALNLASVRDGLTGVNPSVGCVIVKNDEIISIGQTGYEGRPHAESNAINDCNEILEGSKMYITLEPCNHFGETPPCTNIIIKMKIKEVFYSVEDIDKKVKGKSFQIFKSKGIIVKRGLLKNEVNDFYDNYFFNRKNKMPYVTGKIAVSKNNLIYSEKKKKITDSHSDKLTHYLRYKNDSLMVSSTTLNKDDPKLNCRLIGFNKFSPKRIILDNHLKMKINSYIFKTAVKKNTIIFYNKADRKKISLFKKKGITLIKSNLINNRYFDLKSILRKLYNLGSRNLLVEGGDILSGSFLKDKIFNQFYFFKSSDNLIKNLIYKDFTHFKKLKQNYRNKTKINSKFGKDSITLYKK